MAKTSGNGGGASKIPASSAEQNAIRRAAKAGRKGKRGRFGTGETLFGSLEQEAHQARDAKVQAFRIDQAAKAKQHSRFVNLQAGSTAERYASTIIDCFPYVEAPADGSKSRTKVAEEEALALMSRTDIEHIKALELGSSVARQALSWAYNQVAASEQVLVSA